MKFETKFNKIVKNYHKNFRKDSCTHARTRGVNMPARVLTRRNARAHIYASCACVCARIFTKIFVVVLYYLINLSFKFQKDWSFCCRDICNTILTFVRSLIFNVKMVYTNSILRHSRNTLKKFFMSLSSQIMIFTNPDFEEQLSF